MAQAPTAPSLDAEKLALFRELKESIERMEHESSPHRIPKTPRARPRTGYPAQLSLDQEVTTPPDSLCLSHACIAFRQHVVDLMLEYAQFDEERRFYCDRAVAPRDLLLHISAGLGWTLQGDTPCGYTAPQRARL